MESKGKKRSSSLRTGNHLTLRRLQRDAEYFQSKLNKINGFGDLGEHLLELVKQKTPTAEAKENGSNGGANTNSSSDTSNGKKSP